jgi:hypothetical protein
MIGEEVGQGVQEGRTLNVLYQSILKTGADGKRQRLHAPKITDRDYQQWRFTTGRRMDEFVGYRGEYLR